eukprot:1493164-Rhodomonas_salina.2
MPDVAIEPWGPGPGPGRARRGRAAARCFSRARCCTAQSVSNDNLIAVDGAPQHSRREQHHVAYQDSDCSAHYA